MRYQGEITGWKDDQGYGFVISNTNGEKAFVHISAFESRSRRPSNGDVITYEVSKDIKRRLQAAHVQFAEERRPYARPRFNGLFGLLVCISFSTFLAYAYIQKLLPVALIYFYLATSLIAFIAYWQDKSAAQSNHWRTQESTLHLFGILGGWPGALIAQRIFHHKSSKVAFQRVFWVTVIINCALLVWLFTKDGSIFLTATIDELTRLIHKLEPSSGRATIEWSSSH